MLHRLNRFRTPPVSDGKSVETPEPSLVDDTSYFYGINSWDFKLRVSQTITQHPIVRQENDTACIDVESAHRKEPLFAGVSSAKIHNSGTIRRVGDSRHITDGFVKHQYDRIRKFLENRVVQTYAVRPGDNPDPRLVDNTAVHLYPARFYDVIASAPCTHTKHREKAVEAYFLTLGRVLFR
jgi:hypothetical protein